MYIMHFFKRISIILYTNFYVIELLTRFFSGDISSTDKSLGFFLDLHSSTFQITILLLIAINENTYNKLKLRCITILICIREQYMMNQHRSVLEL